MKTNEQAQDKIKRICSALRDETLEPAQKEAESIIRDAREQAEKIIAEANKAAEKLASSAKLEIEREKNVFHSSLQQASKQSVEALRQEIENKFFNKNLYELIKKNGADPQLIANLINAIAKSIEKDGLRANLTALIPEVISAKQVNELLLQDVLKVLQNQTVDLGDFAAGAQMKLDKESITIDISEHAIKELLASHVVRKDFRKMVFAS